VLLQGHRQSRCTMGRALGPAQQPGRILPRVRQVPRSYLPEPNTDVYHDIYLKSSHNISWCAHCCRAGRDGQPSDSVLYCSQAELKQLKKLERPLRAGAAGAVAQ
jgi:hypothetical protein